LSRLQSAVAADLHERGYFWYATEILPKGHFAPESAVPGLLKIDTNGYVELELDSFLKRHPGFGDKFSSVDDGSPRLVAIQGLLYDRHEHALLVEAWENGVSFRSEGPNTQRFRATMCLVGRESISHRHAGPSVSRVEFDLAGYGAWLASSAFKDMPHKRKTQFTYVRPKQHRYVTPWGSLSLARSLTYEIGVREGEAGFSATERATLVAQFRRTIPLRKVLEHNLLVEDLLLLLSNNVVRPNWSRVRVGRKRSLYRLYHSRWKEPEPAKTDLPWIRFPDVADTFGDIFTAWQTGREKFGPGYYLYLGTRRGVSLYEEHRLINLIWGLETLHRRKFGDGIPSHKLTARLDRLYGSVSDNKDLIWLKRQLQHAAEPRLADRLFQLFKGLPLGLEATHLREFCDRCAKYRNDMSHHGGARAGEDYGKLLDEWSEHASALSALYHLLLLAEIGIPDRLLDRIIRGPSGWKFGWHFRPVGLSLDS